jgi:hypothetical protein
MDDFSSVSNDQLADQIVTWSGRIAAGEARLLALIAEFDRREAWGGVGLLSCAHWLAWRTGLSPGTARDRVRVARALTLLPDVRTAFSAGRLSYSQVRAITRVAAPDDQERWIEAARCSTAGQLERLVRGVRRARKVDEDAADPELAAWRTRSTRSYDDDGNAVYRIVLPAEQAAVLDAALEVVRAEADRLAEGVVRSEAAGASALAPSQDQRPQHLRLASGGSAETTSPQATTLAEVFVELARAALAAQTTASPTAARKAKAELVAQVDPLSGWGRLRDGELLPPTSLRAVMRTLPGRGGRARLRPVDPADLRRHDQGRRQRLPSPALRQLIGVLDGERCRFPGCTRRRKLHAHHVRYWRDGGGTDLDNLLLLCGRHHTLVHQHGFILALAPNRRLAVTTADGVPVLHHPGLPWRPAEELDPDHQVDSDTLPPDHVRSRIDLGYAVMVLMQQSA